MNSENKIVANALATVRKVAVNSQTIVIRPSPTADTRSADHKVSQEELAASTEQHIEDVGKGMDFVAKKIREAGKNHDWTKLRYMKAFYAQFSNAQKTGVLERAYMNTQKMISDAVVVETKKENT